jgi:hypothetical protein
MDMASGNCMSQIKCTHCHDPHERGPGAGAKDQTKHLQACTDCHQDIAMDSAAHSGHAASAASCLDCHMPKIVKGVDQAVRSHRISMPVDEKMLARGSFNACNLCHLDKTIGWTLNRLRSQWGRSFASEASWREDYGEQPVGELWLEADDANTRSIAFSAYSRSRLGKSAAERLLRIVDDDIAFNRMWNLFAFEDVLGRKLSRAEFDPLAPPRQRWKRSPEEILRREGVTN